MNTQPLNQIAADIWDLYSSSLSKTLSDLQS